MYDYNQISTIFIIFLKTHQEKSDNRYDLGPSSRLGDILSILVPSTLLLSCELCSSKRTLYLVLS